MEGQVSGFGNAYFMERQKGSQYTPCKDIMADHVPYIEIKNLYFTKLKKNSYTSELRMHCRVSWSIHLNSKLS